MVCYFGEERLEISRWEGHFKGERDWIGKGWIRWVVGLSGVRVRLMLGRR